MKPEWRHVAITYEFGKPETVRGWIDGVPTDGSWDLGGPMTDPPVVDDDAVVARRLVWAHLGNVDESVPLLLAGLVGPHSVGHSKIKCRKKSGPLGWWQAAYTRGRDARRRGVGSRLNTLHAAPRRQSGGPACRPSADWSRSGIPPGRATTP